MAECLFSIGKAPGFIPSFGGKKRKGILAELNTWKSFI